MLIVPDIPMYIVCTVCVTKSSFMVEMDLALPSNAISMHIQSIAD